MKNIVLFGVLCFECAMGQVLMDSLYLKSADYKQFIKNAALSTSDSTEIIFLGNSITFGGNWSELLDRTKVVNHGVAGDNTVGMLHRMFYIHQIKPKFCFIMAGINDLYADASVETTFRNYMMIIDSLRLHNIIPIIQSTLHVNPKWKRTKEKNPEVEKLNLLLKDFAQKNLIQFVDVNSVLSDNGILRDEFTSDGVHLTATAYLLWRDLLIPILKQYEL